jgi:TPR repeat protein
MNDADAVLFCARWHLYAGLGVAPDAAAAYSNYKKAHNLGHWKAALPIAELHMKGTGTHE